MPWQPVPIVGGSSTDVTRPYSSADSINYIPEASETADTQTPTILRGLPGMTLFVDDADGPAERGTHNVEGRIFRVVGTRFLEVKPDGSTVSRGTVGGSGDVTMQHNQITNGSQLAIGTGGSLGYVFNTVTNVLTQITDPGFAGGHVIGYVDSYTVWIAPSRSFWYISDLADALSYNELQRFEAEASPDKIITGIISHNLVFIFGARTTEVYQDNGTSTGTFVRIPQMIIERGCAGVFGVVNLDNAVVLLGDDGIFYRFDGTTPKRISTHPEERAIAGRDLSNVKAFIWSDAGHAVAYWTFPDGFTVGYDVSSGLWHRRQSYGLKRWRVSSLTLWHGSWYAGDAFNGNFYKLNWQVYHDAGVPLVAERTAGSLHANGNRVRIDAVRLFMDTGKPRPYNVTAWARLPDSYVESLDGGASFSNGVLIEDGSYLSNSKFLFPVAARVRITVLSYDATDAGVPLWQWNSATESQTSTSGDPAVWLPASFIADIDAGAELRVSSSSEEGGPTYAFLLEIETTKVVDDHIVEICYSKDGGYNFGNWRQYDLRELGRLNKPIIWRRFGTQLHWIFRVRVSSPCKRDIIGASAMLKKLPS